MLHLACNSSPGDPSFEDRLAFVVRVGTGEPVFNADDPAYSLVA